MASKIKIISKPTLFKIISAFLILSLIYLGYLFLYDPITETKQPVQTTLYVGSVNSDVYHVPSCQLAKRIKDKNLITFSTAEEARNKGYRPCKVCKP